MGKNDARVDANIARSAEFARPILKHIRKVVHAALPQVEEDLKWGAPHFMYKGMLCGMAAFKQHCTFGFWRAKELAAQHKELNAREKREMVQFGNLKSVGDLPSDKMLRKLVKAAAALNDSGTKALRAAKAKKPAPKPPAEFHRRAQDNQIGSRKLFRLQSQPAARVHRVDHRSQARRNAPAPHRDGSRMDRGGQVAQLEV